jgi:hypothetical protein
VEQKSTGGGVMVKRYYPDCFVGEAFMVDDETNQGDWVAYKDYQQLEKRIAELERISTSQAVDIRMTRDQLIKLKDSVPRFIPISEQKPASKKRVKVSYLNDNRKRCIVIGCYIAHRSVACEDFCNGETKFDHEAETGIHWVPEGWFEQVNGHNDSFIQITEGEVDYWMDLGLVGDSNAEVTG